MYIFWLRNTLQKSKPFGPVELNYTTAIIITIIIIVVYTRTLLL